MKTQQRIDQAMLPDFSEKNLSTVALELSETIPSSWYTDPQFHDADKECIFSQTWQYIGHDSQVPTVGDYFLGTAAGNPVPAPGRCGVIV